jgi:hypothetical protein
MMICDFCSAPSPTWKYPCKDFQALDLDVLKGVSTGAWSACEICHCLIDSGNMRELLDRSYNTFIEKNPEFELIEREGMANIKDELGKLHALFTANRTTRLPLPVLVFELGLQ